MEGRGSEIETANGTVACHAGEACPLCKEARLCECESEERRAASWWDSGRSRIGSARRQGGRLRSCARCDGGVEGAAEAKERKDEEMDVEMRESEHVEVIVCGKQD